MTQIYFYSAPEQQNLHHDLSYFYVGDGNFDPKPEFLNANGEPNDDFDEDNFDHYDIPRGYAKRGKIFIAPTQEQIDIHNERRLDGIIHTNLFFNHYIQKWEIQKYYTYNTHGPAWLKQDINPDRWEYVLNVTGNPFNHGRFGGQIDRPLDYVLSSYKQLAQNRLDTLVQYCQFDANIHPNRANAFETLRRALQAQSTEEAKNHHSNTILDVTKHLAGRAERTTSMYRAELDKAVITFSHLDVVNEANNILMAMSLSLKSLDELTSADDAGRKYTAIIDKALALCRNVDLHNEFAEILTFLNNLDSPEGNKPFKPFALDYHNFNYLKEKIKQRKARNLT